MSFLFSSSSAPSGKDELKVAPPLTTSQLSKLPFVVLSTSASAFGGKLAQTGPRKRGKGRSGNSGRTLISTKARSAQYALQDKMPFMSVPQQIVNQDFIIEGFGTQGPFLTTSVAIDSTGQNFFTLSTYVDQYAQLGVVFDQYKILCLEYWVSPRTSIDAFTAAGTNLGRLAVVVDFDDATALPSFAAATDYATALVVSGGTCVYQKFVPHVAVAVYAGGVFTSFGNEVAPWIDAASPSVEHYGLKAASTVTSQVVTYDATIRYVIAYRNSR